MKRAAPRAGSRIMSVDDVRRAIESAFAPLRCTAEVFDRRRQIRFRIVDPDGRVVSENVGRPLDVLRRDPRQLQDMIAFYRGRLAERGLLDAASGERQA